MSVQRVRYHHLALIDFDHCKKGRCVNCSLKQRYKCEVALNRSEEALDRQYAAKQKGGDR